MTDQEIQDSLKGTEMEETTSWTSIDLYYKGFHVKKSVPENHSFQDIKKVIDKAIDEGFEPSWNKDTSTKQLDPDPKWVQQETAEICPAHQETMKKSKKGKWYHLNEDESQMCMGTGYFALNK